MIAIAIDIGTMTTGTPGATQSLRPTAPRIVDVAAIGKKAPLSPLSILAGTASRHAGRVRRRASTLPSVVGNAVTDKIFEKKKKKTLKKAPLL